MLDAVPAVAAVAADSCPTACIACATASSHVVDDLGLPLRFFLALTLEDGSPTSALEICAQDDATVESVVVFLGDGMLGTGSAIVQDAPALFDCTLTASLL